MVDKLYKLSTKNKLPKDENEKYSLLYLAKKTPNRPKITGCFMSLKMDQENSIKTPE